MAPRYPYGSGPPRLLPPGVFARAFAFFRVARSLSVSALICVAALAGCASSGPPTVAPTAPLVAAETSGAAPGPSEPRETMSAAGDDLGSEGAEAPSDEDLFESSFQLPDDEMDPLFDDDFDLASVEVWDPFEEVNRGILVFNQVLDQFVLDPVTRVYRFLLPQVVRQRINKFLDNVNSPQVLLNDVLQLEWTDAGVVTARLLINSTIGVAGFFDPATSFGLEAHSSDFDQTLAIAGAPSGPYMVLPVLGPTTARGGVGLGVDAIFHPTFFLLAGTELIFYGSSAGLNTRARHFEEIKALKESSIDFYAAMRSGYLQNREGEIWERREDRRPPGASSSESAP